MADPSVVRFRQVVQVALRQLEARRAEINELNVFPVADGDTGDNVVRTMNAVLQALNHLEHALEDPPRGAVVDTVRQSALLGARGNSGVILSQIVRGAAEILATQPGRLVDPQLISDALARAAEAARESVSEPVEGTMLTAIDEMARAAEAELGGRSSVVGPDPTDSEQNQAIAEMLAVVLEAGETAVRRSPEQLGVLAEARTVDAGAHALVVLVRGLIAGLVGDNSGLPELPHYPPAHVAGLQHEDPGHRWCMNLIVRGKGLEPEPPAQLGELGDSIEVVGDSTMLRVHIHTDERDRVERLFSGMGEVHVDSCDDMHAQIAERDARVVAGRSAVVAVTGGDGMRSLFAELGAYVLDGGATLNPSTQELLSAIESAPAEEVVLLPNSPNVRMAADEAAQISEKSVAVVGCDSQQAALAALPEVDPARSAAENSARLSQALERIRSGGVAAAVKDDGEGRFVAGDSVGFIDGEIVTWGTPASTLRATLERIGDGAELVTVLCGPEAPVAADEIPAELPGGAEVEVHDGGQPGWWWLIAAE